MADRHDPKGSVSPSFPGTFLQAVRESLARRNREVTRWQNRGVYYKDGEGEQYVGLSNLYLRARRVERTEWPALIDEFIDNLDSAIKTGVSDRPFEEIAGQLMPRVGKPFSFNKPLDVWTRPLGNTDLVMMLVLDFPRSMTYVNQEAITKSSIAAEEWAERALENLLDRSPPECLSRFDEEHTLMLVKLNDAYDAARALVLHELRPDEPAGFFVALPSRDLLLVEPVNPHIVPVLHQFQALAASMSKNAPYAISDQVFWVHRGEWYRVDVKFENDRLSLGVPDALGEVLDAMVRHADDGSEDEEDEASS